MVDVRITPVSRLNFEGYALVVPYGLLIELEEVLLLSGLLGRAHRGCLLELAGVIDVQEGVFVGRVHAINKITCRPVIIKPKLIALCVLLVSYRYLPQIGWQKSCWSYNSDCRM